MHNLRTIMHISHCWKTTVLRRKLRMSHAADTAKKEKGTTGRTARG